MAANLRSTISTIIAKLIGLNTQQTDLSNQVNNLKIGGRNLLLNSSVGRTTIGTTTYNISPNIDLSMIDELVLSVDVDVENMVSTGGRYPRIGAEIQVFYDLAGKDYKWFAVWLAPNATPQTLKKRLVAKLAIPNGKRIAKLTYNKVQINNVRFDRAEVKNIKLEVGNIASEWTAAPEDLEAQIAALTSRVVALENRQTNQSNGVFGD